MVHGTLRASIDNREWLYYAPIQRIKKIRKNKAKHNIQQKYAAKGKGSLL